MCEDKPRVENQSNELSIEMSVNEDPTKILPAFLSKTVNVQGRKVPGVDVKTHSVITGYVAEAICRSLPNSLQGRLQQLNAPFWAACHDIGKISPDFQRLLWEAIDHNIIDKYPVLKEADAEHYSRESKSFHAVVSAALFNKRREYGKYLARVIGWHHGFITGEPEGECCEIYGGNEWSSLRHNLYNELKELFGTDTFIKMNNEDDAALIGGLITVSDWIASGEHFAQFTLEHGKSDEVLKKLAEEAVAYTGYKSLIVNRGLSFKEIFGFEPRAIQQDLFEAVKEPGVYVLEAPMGLGKTEAALYAAYKMLAAGKASGIYFGLPTQLTSDKIHERVDEFLNKIVSQNSQVASLKLLHSSAWLADLSELGGEAALGHSWFDNRKRGILAPFAVGTVDQALMAVINVKHCFVRDFGLAGKVVILDEVHSYDSYTSTLLQKLIARLRALNCTVIVLSATLTAAQKKKLLSLPDGQDFKSSYPLISEAVKTEPFLQHESEASSGNQVDIKLIIEEQLAIEEVLKRAERGEQVLWIENTVPEAQAKYRILAARGTQLNIECGLLHSRFTQTDRQTHEDKWVFLYGKSGAVKRCEHGRILVGTQVLEQSIDIDADFLATRLCPMDMLLQRIGRLWRHSSNNQYRPAGSSCETWVLGPVNGDFGKSKYVYAEYVLWRTLEVLKTVDSIKIPEDVRNLLEQTYCEKVNESQYLCKLKGKMSTKIKDLEQAALIAGVIAQKTKDDDIATTRYTDAEIVSVLLFSKFERLSDGRCSFAFYGEDKQYSIAEKTSKGTLRLVAQTLQKHTVSVYEKDAPQYSSKLDALKSCIYLGNSDSRPIRAAIVDNVGELTDLNGNSLNANYSRSFGYVRGENSGRK